MPVHNAFMDFFGTIITSFSHSQQSAVLTLYKDNLIVQQDYLGELLVKLIFFMITLK